METEGKVLIKAITQNKSTFLKNKTCNFSLELNVKQDEYVFEKASINLNQLALDLNGKFTYRDSLENVRLNYTAPDLEIASVLSLLPEKYADKINDYE